MTGCTILAIDQGTTNTKAVLLAVDGDVLASASVPMIVTHARPGWAEQSSDAIRDSVEAAVRAVLEVSDGAIIDAIAISNQRETALLWDMDGNPVGPAVLWQCRRSAELCSRLHAEGQADFIQARSGLALDAMFSAGKWRWLLDNVTAANDLAAEGRLRAGTVDSWLLWALTGGAVHATDASNASRTQLLCLDTGKWDAELLEIFGIPSSILPAIHPSDHRFGLTKGGFAGLPDSIPVHAMMGDSHAALFGHGIKKPGRVKVTLGTGSSLMCPTGALVTSHEGLSGTVAWAMAGKISYALEGNISVSGHAITFICKMLGLEGPQALTRLAESVEDSGGVTFVPALAGLGAPYWVEEARGLICGLTLASTPANVARATFEAIAHQICDVVAAMEADLGCDVASISVDGGAAQNDLLLQLLANLSDRPVLRPVQTELSAIGAAMMAAHGLGQDMATSLTRPEREFRPVIDMTVRTAQRLAWKDAVRRTKAQIPSV